MRALASSQVVAIWERGSRQGAAARALTMLGAALPGSTREELARYGIGRRDACLLELRERTFPGALEAYAECPRCAAPLEYALEASDLRARGARAEEGPLTMEAEGVRLELRIPDTTDLECAVRAASVEEARREIARRCISGWPGGELPEAVVAQAAARLEEADPGADLVIDLECPACGERWQAVFDIASYLWTEVQAAAKRLMGEVVVLARAFGWRERDILAMSPARRRFYLEAAG